MVNLSILPNPLKISFFLSEITDLGLVDVLVEDVIRVNQDEMQVTASDTELTCDAELTCNVELTPSDTEDNINKIIMCDKEDNRFNNLTTYATKVTACCTVKTCNTEVTSLGSDVYTSEREVNTHEMEITTSDEESSHVTSLDQPTISTPCHSLSYSSDCSQASPIQDNTTCKNEVTERDKGLVLCGMVPDVVNYKLEICPLMELGGRCSNVTDCKYSHSEQEQLRAKRLLVSIMHIQCTTRIQPGTL